MSSELFEGLIQSTSYNEWEQNWLRLLSQSESLPFQPQPPIPNQAISITDSHSLASNFVSEPNLLNSQPMVPTSAFQKIRENDKIFYECTWPNW